MIDTLIIMASMTMQFNAGLVSGDIVATANRPASDFIDTVYTTEDTNCVFSRTNDYDRDNKVMRYAYTIVPVNACEPWTTTVHTYSVTGESMTRKIIVRAGN